MLRRGAAFVARLLVGRLTGSPHDNRLSLNAPSSSLKFGVVALLAIGLLPLFLLLIRLIAEFLQVFVSVDFF